MKINSDIDISEVYDDVAVITICGNSEEANITVTGSQMTIQKCLKELAKLVKVKKVKVH